MRRPFVEPELHLVVQLSDRILTNAEAQDAAMIAMRRSRYDIESVSYHNFEVPTVAINIGDSQPSVDNLEDIEDELEAAFDDKGVDVLNVRVLPSIRGMASRGRRMME